MTNSIPQTSSDELDTIAHKYCGASKTQYLNGDFVLPEVIEAELKAEIKRLISQEAARLTAESNYTAVKDAFDELRTTPKDSWYGTMPEILNRLKGQA